LRKTNARGGMSPHWRLQFIHCAWIRGPGGVVIFSKVFQAPVSACTRQAPKFAIVMNGPRCAPSSRRTVGCNRENNELRAECTELHEARGWLDFIKTQSAPDQPPQW